MSSLSAPAVTVPPEPLAKDAAAVPLLAASRVGRFVLLQQLGAGGMGTVFSAYDPELDRRVALKILHRPQSRDASSRKQGLREARALARVAHPRVVSVYDVGEADELSYMAMEFVEGQTLRSWQTQERRSFRAILHMYLQAGEGLQAAHKVGVTHRDFKPENVLVGARDQLPKVVDFGIARLHDAAGEVRAEGDSPAAGLVAGAAARSGPLTQESQMPGTLGYMSPEQQQGGSVTAQSDQYSFCVALWEALYGELPPMSTRAPQPAMDPSLRSATERAPAGPAQATVDVPPAELLTLLKRGMSLQPEQRFASMSALLAALWRQHDAQASAQLSRRFVTVAVPLLMLTVWLALRYGVMQRIRLISLGAAVSAVSLIVYISAALVYRRGLRQNPLHRFLWMLLLVNLLQTLGVRLVSSLVPAGGYRRGAIIELILTSGTVAVISSFILRRARWLLLLTAIAIATLVCRFAESLPIQLLGLFNSVIFLTLLWQWRALSLANSPPEAQVGQLLWLNVPLTRQGAACVHCGQSPVRSAGPSD